ncbi:universal stress protein [Poseidonibacter antarcticus]|uniref:universal stress protein n=1 Tax=Poseidonibacter antarcticus TaxID=2478538 RepID=UPI000EF534E4|nr:universal stress protein [Poseidonibacter antarcticus]
MSIKRNILVGIDFSKSSIEVLKRAFNLVKSIGAKLTIVHAIDKGLFDKYFSRSNDEELITKAKENIEKIITNLQEKNIEYSIVVQISTPTSLIIDMAKEINPSLIVVGVNSIDNFKTKVFGSTSVKIIQNTKLPVLIVKNNCEKDYKDILAFTDLSPISLKSINFTKEFFENSNLKVIHAYKQVNDFTLTFHDSLEHKKEIQEDITQRAKERFEEFKKVNKITNSELIEVYNAISEVLLSKTEEENKDLVVLGSNGVNNADSFLYGSIALYMMENVKNDILIYVPDEV